ncbi:MAG TPA: DinB family protein [Acidobacteriaceae bacterium]|nr:DinB family protein [Acidobacteriaceae bacterium]
MRRLHLLPLLVLVSASFAPITSAQTPAAKPVPTLRWVLLAQLQSTHNKAEWFVPIDTAVAGLTPEQAKWVPTNAKGKLDPDASHSVGMLAYHLLFWNTRALEQMKGEKPAAAPSNNEETFNDFDAATWAKTVHDLDAVMTSLEDFVAHADDATLTKLAPTIAHIGTHNAYHTGQILYVRKLQGSWNPANGVK